MTVAFDVPRSRELERHDTLTPVGVRFWDAALDAQVREGLRVRAWPAAGARPVREAYRTASDVYALRDLPGLVSYERPSGAPETLSPPAGVRFVLEVVDRHGRFLPVAFDTDLPPAAPGLLLSPEVSSPSVGAPGGFLLFSAATRGIPAWFGAVRGELRRAEDGLAAAWALVRVTDPLGGRHHGLADEAGRFAVLVPYPDFTELLASPPVGPAAKGLQSASWEVRLEVDYSPGDQTALPGTAVPSYLSLLTQAPATIWDRPPADGGSELPDWLGELGYGRPAIAHTEGTSVLLVSPESSSP